MEGVYWTENRFAFYLQKSSNCASKVNPLPISMHINRLMTEYISGRAHLKRGIDSVFLSSNEGRLQNVAMA